MLKTYHDYCVFCKFIWEYCRIVQSYNYLYLVINYISGTDLYSVLESGLKGISYYEKLPWNILHLGYLSNASRCCSDYRLFRSSLRPHDLQLEHQHHHHHLLHLPPPVYDHQDRLDLKSGWDFEPQRLRWAGKDIYYFFPRYGLSVKQIRYQEYWSSRISKQ